MDRSAAYAARHIAKNLVAAGVADEVLVELSYAIGIAQPLSIYVDTYRSPRPAALEGMTDGEIARRIGKLFDLRPAAIVRRFGLKNPIFEATASYGHFDNRPYTERVKVWENGRETEREIEFFGWGEARCRGADSQRVRIVTVRVAENRDVRRGCPDFCVSGHTNRAFPFVCPTNRNKT